METANSKAAQKKDQVFDLTSRLTHKKFESVTAEQKREQKPEVVCDKGFCVVTWKPKRPAA